MNTAELLVQCLENEGLNLLRLVMNRVQHSWPMSTDA